MRSLSIDCRVRLRCLIIAVVVSVTLGSRVTGDDRQWSLDQIGVPGLSMRGNPSLGNGVTGRCLVFDGLSLLTVGDSQGLAAAAPGFTLTVWVNPYLLSRGQQMIVAKNRYALDEREWGVMIDRDNLIRLYLWQGKWVTVPANEAPTPGRWHQVGIVVRPAGAELWIDGDRAGQVGLMQSIAPTDAPLTFGGVDDDGRVRQLLHGALDEVRLFDRPLDAQQMAALYRPVSTVHELPAYARAETVTPDLWWGVRGLEHARQDRTSTVFDGMSPDKLACDTTLRKMPDGSWVTIMLGGGDTEPLPQNRVFLSRSTDQGETWSPMVPIDLGVKARDPNAALVPSELMVRGGRCTLFVATHDGTFSDWKEWMTHSDDSCRTWSELQPAPGRLRERTFIRNHIVTRDGRILLPYQHYLRVGDTRSISGNRRFSPPTDPRNGVLISEDGGTTWSEHGNIRISPNDDYHGWAENNIVELSDGRIAMLIRADRLGGALYYAESSDGGRTWPAFAQRTAIPNPGSKATLYSLAGDAVALLHNPNPHHRRPLALWISFDDMRTWPYQRILVPESIDGPSGRLNYPDGFVSDNKKWLQFAFDDNRHRAVYVGARLPD